MSLDTRSADSERGRSLAEIVDALDRAPAVQAKLGISRCYAPASGSAMGVPIGDDCAAIDDGSGGHLLLAAEGLLDDFLTDDPWFAGYSAVMVNVSDVCAMGGRPIAVVDVIWTPSHRHAAPVWDGMRAAAEAYDVPIVGGHTTITGGDGVHLAVSIMGRASSLLSSFTARPGDEILMAVDLDGDYRGDKPFWNASVGTPPARLRLLAGLLPTIAERGWCDCAKDISNGGVVGTLAMLAECSSVGAVLDLDDLPSPRGVDLLRWLLSFPSFGFLLSVESKRRARVIDLFRRHGVACRRVGRVTDDGALQLRLAGQSRELRPETPEMAHA